MSDLCACHAQRLHVAKFHCQLVKVRQRSAMHKSADGVKRGCIDWQVEVLACLAGAYLAPPLSYFDM